MSVVLRNKQLLVLAILVLVIIALITVLVGSLVLHLNTVTPVQMASWAENA